MKTRERWIRRIWATHGRTMKGADKWAWRYFYDIGYLLRLIDELRREQR